MKTIGEELQKKREEINMSLEYIAEKTNIKAEYLLDIELGEFDRLPTFVHAKGFLKTYANFLGLDGLEYSKRLGAQNNLHRQESLLLNPVKNNSRSKVQEVIEDFILFLIKQKRKIISIAVIFIIFVMFIKVIKFIASPSHKKEVIEEQKAAEIPLKEEVVPQIERLDLKITALESVWVTVKIDNKLAFEGVLAKNAGEKWTAQERIEMKIGDAGGIKLMLNGSELTEIGKKGDVVKKLIITRKGIEIS